MKTTLPVICCFILFLTIANSEGWYYGDEKHWPSLCREGHNQSPIPLSEDIATEAEFISLIFERYTDNYPARLKNNGHSAEVRLHVQDQPGVRGGGLPEIYTLDHLHFHWKSEHTIDGYRYPLELHLVHYAKQYYNLTNALNYKDGVAVFSVLFDLSPDNDKEFEPLISVIDKLHDKVDTVEQITIHLASFLPRDTAGFYRYNGSLTTPGCNEGVIWTVFTNTLPISLSQVESFSTIQTEEHTELKQNYRSLQPVNDRTVFLKVSPLRHSGAATVHLFFSFLQFLLFLLPVLFNMYN